MASNSTQQVMGINADTLAEADPANADYFVLAEVTFDDDGNYLDHAAGRDQYATQAEAHGALLLNEMNDYDAGDGGDIWQDVILKSPLFDGSATDADRPERRVHLTTGQVIEYTEGYGPTAWVLA